MLSPASGEVLIADADASIRRLLVAVVQRMSRAAVVASSGRMALDLLADRAFEAVILDLYLPEVSGADVLSSLASRDAALLRRVVVLTTAPQSTCAHRLAVAAVLRKPFAIEDLRAALERCYAPD